MQGLRKRLSYANVMATIAVFIALGGGAYAAIKIPKASVGTKQLKKNAVKSDKIANGAVTITDLKPGQSTVARGTGGPVSSFPQFPQPAANVPLAGKTSFTSGKASADIALLEVRGTVPSSQCNLLINLLDNGSRVSGAGISSLSPSDGSAAPIGLSSAAGTTHGLTVTASANGFAAGACDGARIDSVTVAVVRSP